MMSANRMRSIVLSLAAAVLVLAGAARGVEFTQAPTAKADGKGLKIEFAVSEYTDATVEVVEAATGKVVRHLASGVLGPNPPAPFVADSLKQTIHWDRLDDDGEKVAAKCQVRVGLGMKAELDRIYGWDNSYALGKGGPSGIAVTPDGEVLVQSSGQRRCFRITAFSREGKYLRTVYPYRGDLPEEKVKGFGRLKQKDGSFLPVVYQGHHGVLLPEVHNPDRQTMAVSPQGWLVFPNTLANGDWYGVQTDRRRALIMGLDGSCPRDTFFGPTIVKDTKYGEAHLAFSPDGEFLYAAGFGDRDRPDKPQMNKPIHAVFRARLDSTKTCEILIGDPAKAGDDDHHFNGPAGLAVDAKGNLYVADFGNNRVMVYDPAGKKLLARVDMEGPDQLQINPKTGELYVLSFSKDAKTATISKIGPLPEFKAVASTTFPKFNFLAPIFALDYSASPPLLWFGRLQYGVSGLTAMEDRGGELVFVDKAERSIGYKHATDHNTSSRAGNPMPWPGYLAVDPTEEFLYSGCIWWNRIDLETGEVKRAELGGGYDAAFGQDGNLYTYGHAHYNDPSVWKHDRDGKRIPFEGGAMEFLGGKNQFRGPSVGSRGLQVDKKGNIYIYEVFDRQKLKNGTRIAVYDPSGKPINKELILTPVSAGGFQLDRKGNLYVICNVRPRGVVYPDVFAEQDFLPDPLSLRHPWDWPHAYLNYYLFHIGSVFKFGPEGGSLLVNWEDRDVKAVPEGSLAGGNIPEKQVSGIYHRTADLKGAKMQYFGTSPTSAPAAGGKDPWCMCFSPRFAVDGHGRTFMPDTMRFQVAVADSGGNEMLRFGRYGNADQQGPEITFQYFMYVAKANDSIYVSDFGNQRIVKVKLSYAQSATTGG